MPASVFFFSRNKALCTRRTQSHEHIIIMFLIIFPKTVSKTDSIVFFQFWLFFKISINICIYVFLKNIYTATQHNSATALDTKRFDKIIAEVNCFYKEVHINYYFSLHFFARFKVSILFFASFPLFCQS